MSATRHFKEGELISDGSDTSKKFFVLLFGKAAVYENEKEIEVYDKAGDIFGEMNLILNKSRTARIKALETTGVLEIEGELEEIVKLYPDITKKLIKSLADKLIKAKNNGSSK